MSLPWFPIIVSFMAPYCPHPLDKDGWGLRVHNLTVRGPYFVGEQIDRVGFDLTLLNYSKEVRKYDPLIVAKTVGNLMISVIKPDGDPVRGLGMSFPRNPLAEPATLRPGESASLDFTFAQCGYFELRAVGKNQLRATMKINGKTIVAPPVAMEVVETPADAILLSHTVPLEGRAAQRKPEERERPFVQQVRLGKRTYLIYRRYYGLESRETIIATFRLVELPGKVEMKVEGAFGSLSALTIKYRDANSKSGWTSLVINSIDGMPWTEEEERLRIERTKKAPPAPRPVRP